MSTKAYKEVRPQISFDSVNPPNKNLQEIMMIQQGEEILVQAKRKEQSKSEHKGTQTKDQESSEEYQRMFEICQTLTQEKGGLLDTIDQLKLIITDQEKQLNKVAALGNVYQKESSNSKDRLLEYERKIEQLQNELNRLLMEMEMKDVKGEGNQWISQLFETLIAFLREQNLEELLEQVQSEDCIQGNQIIIEYLMNQFTLKKNQEQKYESHLRDNIQIIYDLQNKYSDITKVQTPKSNLMETLKLSKMSSMLYQFERENTSNILPQNYMMEAQQKILQLKRQGKKINKKWQLFCENILKERHDVLKRQKLCMDQLNDQCVELQRTISDILDQLPQKQQNIWRELLELKAQLYIRLQELANCAEQLDQPRIEADIKLLYKKIAYCRQKLSSYERELGRKQQEVIVHRDYRSID